MRVLSLADAELKRRIHGKWSTRPVSEALDEPKAAERDEQRQLLREDAPDFERCDHEVRLGVGREESIQGWGLTCGFVLGHASACDAPGWGS